MKKTMKRYYFKVASWKLFYIKFMNFKTKKIMCVPPMKTEWPLA